MVGNGEQYQEPYPVDLRRRLRCSDKRRGEHGSQASDEGATVHSSGLLAAGIVAPGNAMDKAGSAPDGIFRYTGHCARARRLREAVRPGQALWMIRQVPHS